LLGIVAGRLTDRFGPRVVVLLFGSFLGIGYLLISRISNIWQFYVVYGVLVGIGLSAATTPTMTTVARWFVKRRGLMAGIVQAGQGVGGMILSPLTGWLILTDGWRSAYVVLGIISLVLIILPALFLRRDPGQVGQLPYGVDEPAEQEVNNQGSGLLTTGFSLGEAVRTRQFWMLCMMFFSFGFCRSTTWVHIAPHVTDLGFSLAIAANVLAIASGVGIVGRIGMGRLTDLIGSKRAFMVGFIVMAVGLIWVMGAKETWALYLFAAIFGFSWGALAVTRMPLLAEVFGLGSLGTILGIVEFGAQTGAITGPFLAGWLFDITGEYMVTFVVTAVVAVIGLVLTMFLRPIGSERGGK